MERRLEKIELKMNELYGKKLKNVEEKRAAPGRTGSGVFRCSMGRALLMLGILEILSSVNSMESEPAGTGRNGSRREAKRKITGNRGQQY
jgi:hypothetical protein